MENWVLFPTGLESVWLDEWIKIYDQNIESHSLQHSLAELATAWTFAFESIFAQFLGGIRKNIEHESCRI